GVIKTVLALRHGILPRTLHADAPTPEVDWSAGTVQLLTEQRVWPDTGRPRRAGVSAFGGSGTNAHVILEQAPAPEEPAEPAKPVEPPVVASPVPPWVLSARSVEALAGQARRLADHVAAGPEPAPAGVARSLLDTRAVFEHRAVVVGADRGTLLDGLAALAAGTPAPGVVTGRAADGRAVFVFPGQGSQWAGMAVELLDCSPVFAVRIGECEAALAPHVDWSRTEVLRGVPGAPGLDRVDVVQPVLWAVMVSLAALWRSFGVEPAAVVGHSQGEIAAACVAGALSVEDAAKIVALRSRALLALSGQGGMVSVPLPADEVQQRLVAFDGRISVAAVNGPSSTVVSGDVDALDDLLAGCESDGVRAKRIEVDYASHSPHVERVCDELLTALADIAPRSAGIPFHSTVVGEPVDTATLDAGYWYRNLREPVRFAPVIQTLAQHGFGIFVEVSPHPVVTVGIGECVEQAGVTAVAVGTLRRDEGGPERLYQSLAEAWVHGAAVDWRRAIPADAALVDLPTYAF
ncbi:MAG TPA: acyltransferase domain-containing protein, partial [Micromonospora sp.]